MFEPFGKLPPELRIKIWVLSLPGSQFYSPKDNYKEGYEIKLSRASIPVALQVTRESRRVALQHYTRREGPFLRLYQKQDKIKYASYIDFERDIVVFPTKSILSYPLELEPIKQPEETWLSWNKFFSKSEMGQIANLRIFSSDFSFTESQLNDLLKNWLPVFRSLKHLEFTVLLDPTLKDVFKNWDGEEWLIEDRLILYNKSARQTVEDVKSKQMSLGISYNEPTVVVDAVRAKTAKSGSWQIEI